MSTIRRFTDGGLLEPVSEQDFANLSRAHPDLLFLVGAHVRPGTELFVVKLEYEHFTPLTPAAEHFEFYMLDWEDGMWLVTSIPLKDRHIAEQVAKESGLRLADGVPTMIGSKGVKTFPLRGDNVWTLENDKDSPVYQGFAGQKLVKAVVKAVEKEAVDKVLKAHEDRMRKNPMKGSGVLALTPERAKLN